jgi:uncharacterized phage-associated protein
MSKKFNLNTTKMLNSILFVLDGLGGKCDFHKIFKILYFADQKHLTYYGVPITGDFYIAMKNGPVPSKSYEIFKVVRGDSAWVSSDFNYQEWFEIEKTHFVVAKKKCDIEELSESNIECLTESIQENSTLNFDQLSDKSHKTAWNNAIDNEMDTIDIAQEGGANEEMIKYIRINLENQTTFNSYATVR